MSSEVDALFDRLRSSPFHADPNQVPQQGPIGDGNIQPTSWYSEHGYSAAIAMGNLLEDPVFDTTGNGSVGIDVGTVANTTYIGWSWYAHYVLNSGVAATSVTSYRNYDRTIPSDNPFNSAQQYLEIVPGSGASSITLYVYPVNSWNATGIDYSALPWLLAGVRTQMQFVPGAGATLTAKLEITNSNGSAVVATGESVDLMGDIFAQTHLLKCAYAYGGGATRWRFRIDLIATTGGSAQSLGINVGEPQFHLNYTPDLLPFYPSIATWFPRSLINRGNSGDLIRSVQDFTDRTFLDYRLRVDGVSFWGDGTANPDLALRRLSAKVMRVDSNEGGAVLFTPVSTAQVIAAGTAILADSNVVQLTSSGNVTVTAAPTIADGQDGQIVTILNVDTADTITLQNQGTLAGSNLRLTAATVALAPRQSIQLMYSATVGDWVQIGNKVAVL